MDDTLHYEDTYAEDELPPRPRRRLLTPWTVLLMLVLFAACGFIGGVLVEKGQTTSSTLVGATTAGRTGATGASGATAGGFASRFGSALSGSSGTRTVGTVTNINGNKLYVTTVAGNTVEVVTTSQSKITKSQTVGSNAIRPGDSVIASGVTASNGTLTASTVSDSGAGGLASAFGGGAASSSTGSGGSTTGGAGAGSLFGG